MSNNEPFVQESRPPFTEVNDTPPVVDSTIVEHMKSNEGAMSQLTSRMGDLLARGFTEEEITSEYERLGLADNSLKQSIKSSINEYKVKPEVEQEETEPEQLEIPLSDTGSTLERIKDGDTAVIDNLDTRIKYIDTEESVHPTESKNTKKGKETSEFVKNVIPKDAKVETTGTEKDKFGRTLSQVSVNINGTPIDWGLVVMDNDLSEYKTKFGNAPLDWHDVYKEYYSKYSPYQYGEIPEAMEESTYKDMVNKRSNFNSAYQEYLKTDDRTNLDAAIVDLYGNPEELAHFRQVEEQNNRKEKAIDGSLYAAFELAAKDPTFREQYNTAVRQGALPRTSSTQPRIPSSFWERFGATYEQTTFISNLADRYDLNKARQVKDQTIPLDDVLKDVPELYKDTVKQEYDNHGATAAWVFKDALIEDIANNRVFDSLPLHKQLGYGALAMVLDPVTWLTGGAVGKAVTTTIAKVGTKSIFKNSKLAEASLNIATWGAFSGVEGAVYDAPRYLEGDLTYTGTDYLSTIAMSTAFGLALPTVLQAGGHLFGDGKQLKTSQEKYVDELSKQATKSKVQEPVKVTPVVDSQLETLKRQEDVLAEKLYNNTLQEEDIDALSKLRKEIEKLTNKTRIDTSKKFDDLIDVRELSDVQSIDRDMFNKVLNVSRKTMDSKSPLWTFMTRQAKLNKLALDTTELKTGANELNAQLVKLVAMFPDGKVPFELSSVLNELKMGQQHWVTNNAIEDIIGDPLNQVPLLYRYIKHLEKLDLFDTDIQPTSWLELKEFAPSVLKIAKNSDGFHLDVESALSKEVKFLEDLVILNNKAMKANDVNFTSLVEKLNGMAVNRLTQKELGVLPHGTLKTTDKTKFFPKTVKLTAVDIKAKLKEEGIEQFTPEYKAALSKARQAVNKHAESTKTTKQRDLVRRSVAAKLDRYVEEGKLVKFNPEYIKRKKELEGSSETLTNDVRQVGRLNETVTHGKLIEDKAYGGDASGKYEDFPSETKTSTPEYNVKDIYGAEYTLKENFELDLVKDPAGDIEDLLPRKFNEPIKVDAYNNPTPENLRYLKDQIQTRVLSIINDKVKIGDKIRRKNAIIMDKVVKELSQDATGLIKRAVDSGKLDNILMIIRASEELTVLKAKKAAKIKAVKEKVKKLTSPTEGVEPVSKFESKALNEEHTADYLDDSPKLDATDKAAIKKNLKESTEEAIKRETKRIEEHLSKFEELEKQDFEDATASTGMLDWVGRKLSVLTKDIATTLQTSKSNSMSYIGYKVTELGKGFGGNAQRNATGGIIKHKVLTELQMGFMPDYVKAIHAYSVAKGDNSFQTMNAQQMTGKNNKTVAAFNRDFMWVQAMMDSGKSISDTMREQLKHVLPFVVKWDENMRVAHKYLVDNNIEGFTNQRKVATYVPRVHQHSNYKKAIENHGLTKVQNLITAAILNGTGRLSPKAAKKKADDFIKWVLKQDGTTPVEDMYMPAVDSRALSRINMDMTTNIEGLSMLDLVNNEVMELGIKYSNRVAGWVGLSESTGGLLNSNLAIDAYKAVVAAEGNQSKATVLFDDVINLMFGRPTRNGLAEEIRMFKDLTALTRMGGLGSAQLIESGQVITRGVMNMFSDPAVAKRLFAVATENPDDIGLLKEIQAISRLSDDMEHMQRQSVNLEQSENIGANQFRKMSTQLADTMTFGKYKAPASRLLGKVTGFNAIRRYQSRVAQTGFTLNAIKHFSTGTSAISPKRLADLGLTDVQGKNKDLADTIKQWVEVDSDGLPTKLHFDKWPKHVQKQFTYALLRDEAQNIQKSLVGELPAWYNKPLMALVFQFRQFPIVAQNKQLGRALALADKEAVVATLLNASTAGLVRLSKAAVVAGGISAVSNREYRYNSDTEHLAMDTSKYVAQLGILPDATDFVTKAYQSYDDDGFSKDFGDTMMSFAPMWGLMKDFKDVPNPESSTRERVEATFGILPLGNVLFADMLKAQAQQALAE